MPIADRLTPQVPRRSARRAAVLLVATAIVTAIAAGSLVAPDAAPARIYTTTLPSVPHAATPAPNLSWSSVAFGVSAGLNSTIGISLGFHASFGLTGQPIDEASSLTGEIALAPVPNATLSLEATGLSGQVPIATLGPSGPARIPGLSYNYSGIPLGLAVISLGTLNGSYSVGGASTAGPTAFSWSTPTNLTLPVSAPAGSAGGAIYLNLTGLRYGISVGLDAIGTVPLLGTVTVPLVPLTMIASVAGSPASLGAVYHITPPPSIGTFSATPSTVAVNDPANLTVVASGGSGPLDYAYSSLPAGCSSSSAPTIVCRPSGTGAYSIGVRVTDPQGFNATATTHLTVTSAGVAPSGGGGYSDYLLPAVLVVAVAGAVLAFLLGRRGRKPGPGPIKPVEPAS